MEVTFLDDDTRVVPEHIVRHLPLLNEGHFAILIMDNGERHTGFVSKSNDGLTWMVGGRPLMRVSYAPFHIWIIPWNLFAIVNLADYDWMFMSKSPRQTNDDRMDPTPKEFEKILERHVSMAFRKHEEVDTGHLINALATALTALKGLNIHVKIPQTDQ